MNRTYIIEGKTLLHKMLYKYIQHPKVVKVSRFLGTDKIDCWINKEKKTAVVKFYY